MMGWAKQAVYSVLWFVGMNVAQERNHGAGERNPGYALLMKANKPETALYRAPTFSLVTHGVISSCIVL